MTDGEHADLIRAAASLFLFGIVMAFVATWVWLRRNDGETDGQETEVTAEEFIRAARASSVSDARSAARREREGSSDPDGQAGEAVSLGGGQDQGEGEPDPG